MYSGDGSSSKAAEAEAQQQNGKGGVGVSSASTKAGASDADPASDPWAMSDLAEDSGPSWSELSGPQKIVRFVTILLKLAALMALLYVFFCSLDFLSSSFRLLGGKTAGEFFRNSEHLKNPIVGLMLGILATVLMQSSSTSTSIVVTMVASNFLDVPTAIPIIMGANIGTSVTNTLVSLAQSHDRDEFRRAFAGATVHDMFNWLTVIILLPLEWATGFLFHLTSAIVNNFEWTTNKNANKEMLTLITRPFTDLIIQLDKNAINGMATGDLASMNQSLIKEWCKLDHGSHSHNRSAGATRSLSINRTAEALMSENHDVERCGFLLNGTGLADTWVGLILLTISLVLLCTCLILMVKVLHSMLRGQMAVVIRRTLNADFPGRLGFLTGYAAMLVGCGMTILVQSSSIFTSALTPLVGMGVISVERVYPLTLGSNIGTTTTGILASLAATGVQLRYSIQIALCHLFFNVSGIVLFYPIPFTRVPIALAKGLGNTTAKYRWFSVLYLVLLFFLLPSAIFSLSLAGPSVLLAVGCPVIVVVVLVVLINVAQRRCPNWLPTVLRSWNWLPRWMHSLRPWDRLVMRTQRSLVATCGGFCGCCACCRPPSETPLEYAGYKPSYHSQTTIVSSASLQTLPSVEGIDNPVALQSVTSV